MTAHEILQIRKELRGLKEVAAFVTLCGEESIASRQTTYDAITPDTFNAHKTLHRAVVRRAVRFLQSFGSLKDWDVDQLLPESLPAMSAAA